MKNTDLLKFGRSNKKLQEKLRKNNTHPLTGESLKVVSFDLLAGITCPYAKVCQAHISVDSTGKRKVIDGKDQTVRCYAVSLEAVYTNVYKAHLHNTNLLKACKTKEEIIDLISLSLPKRVNTVRIHSSGDYFTRAYFEAWVEVAKLNPMIHFYSYTKALPFVWANREVLKDLSNFKVTMSKGGHRDDLIEPLKAYGLYEAIMIHSKAEATRRGLDIDYDDTMAFNPSRDFGLLVHGTQPKKDVN